MEIYGKSLIFTVFIIILLIIIEIFFNKYHKSDNVIKEAFEEEEIIITNITKMNPFKGDSSTIVTLEGTGINNIGNIIFKNEIEEDNNDSQAECVILDNQNDNKLQFIPPPYTELGITIGNIREKMKQNKGFEVAIYFVRKEQRNLEKRTTIKLPNISFFYIDKIPYTNNCPTVNTNEVANLVTEDLVQSAPSLEPQYNEGSDLEFTNVILKNKEKKIDKLIEDLKLIFNRNLHIYENQSVDFMETIQALDFLEKYKKYNNSHRYNIHKTINDRYNYNIKY